MAVARIQFDLDLPSWRIGEYMWTALALSGWTVDWSSCDDRDEARSASRPATITIDRARDQLEAAFGDVWPAIAADGYALYFSNEEEHP